MQNSWGKFRKDLTDGRHAETLSTERIIKYYLEEKNKKLTIGEVQGDHNYKDVSYDFELLGPDGESLTFEVKQNKHVDKYGCYFFEIMDQFGRPSGLHTTTAEFYVLVNGNSTEFVVIRTESIRKIRDTLARLNKLRTAKSVVGTVGYVISKNVILEFHEFIMN